MKKALSIVFTLAVFLAVMAAGAPDTSWVQAAKNATQSQRAIQFCRQYAHGWLAHADPTSGLIPRNLRGDAYWNAEDAAADNYPFMVLTAPIVDQSMEYIFKKQRYDGVLEGWHGDGNSARTALLWALQKSQGVSASKYTHRSPQSAVAWQEDLRRRFYSLLKLEDLLNAKIPLAPKHLSSEKRREYVFREVELSSTLGRRIKAVVTLPQSGTPPYPAVVCIHGHGGSRHVVYDRSNVYKGFAAALTERGFVTIAPDVGQHEVYETGRTLLGERLWDVRRCVDYLESMPEVDKPAIGCAGLSLGGEMAMWLAAMDERIAACVSSGFLTVMDQMEHDHCMCWKFEGLRELVDFADIYSLVAPRPLQCQNGLAEVPTMFVVPLARQALKEIRLIYSDMGKPDNVNLAVHRGEHVVDLPSLLEFFQKSLIRK